MIVFAVLDITASRIRSQHRRRRRRQLARGLAPAVNEKEKRRETDEQERASKHPDLVRQERLNLLRWKKRQGNSQARGGESTEASKDQRGLAVTALYERIAGSNFHQPAEHV